MKRFKKVLSLVLTLAMVLAMGTMAFASDPSNNAGGQGTEGQEEKFTITITNSKTGHTYEAYQIFKGDLDTTKQVLSNITWGDAIIAENDTIVNALKNNNAFNNEGTNIFASSQDAADVAKVLSDLNLGANSPIAEAFADAMAAYLNTSQGASSFDQGTYTISDLDAGYYLIKDTADLNGHDAYTDFILEVVKDVYGITPKSAVPTVEKKVFEESYTGTTYGEGYNDIADWDIGDDVPFKLIGTLPSDYADYSSYTYIFHDTLATSLQFNNDVKVYFAEDKAGTNKQEITNAYYTVETTTGDDCSFEIKFDDLTDVSSVTSSSVIIVEYTAELLTTASIGQNDPNNTNEVILEFSNNSNPDGSDDTGKTPEDKVIVFTYELDVTKIDGETDVELRDAEFVLYKTVNEVKQYVQVNATGAVTGWAEAAENEGVTTYPANSTLTSGENGKFIVKGLDDGIYYLEEIKAPDSYNLLENPVTIEIEAKTTNNEEWSGTDTAKEALTSLTITVDGVKAVDGDGGTLNTAESGIVAATVKNNKGATLPSTGGMGTTVFYTVGAILMIGAGVTFIARKRTDKEISK